jgi:hypothetical protein
MRPTNDPVVAGGKSFGIEAQLFECRSIDRVISREVS